MENGKLVGMVSIEDILENIYWPQRRQTTGDIVGEKIETLGIAVKGIMASPVITVDGKTSLRDAEKQMHDHDISCLCVVLADRLVGIVTKLDFLEQISQVAAPARKLTIQFGTKGVDVSADQQAFMMNEFDSFSHQVPRSIPVRHIFCVHEKPRRQRRPRHTTGPLPPPIPHCARHILQRI